MSDNIYIIYKHTSPSGKSYIGQTKNLATRNSAHRSLSSGSTAFVNAIRKYGWCNIIHEILYENLTLEEAKSLERQCICNYNTLSPNGYNIMTGGEGNYVPTDEIKL